MLGWFKKKKQEVAVGPSEETRVPENSDPAAVSDANEQGPHDEGLGDNSVAGPSDPAIPVHSDSKLPVQSDESIEPPAEPASQDGKQSPSVFRRLSERLTRTRESFTTRIDELFLGKKTIDAELFEELEEILVTADLGITTTQNLLEQARKQIKRDSLSDPKELKTIIKDQLKAAIVSDEKPSELDISSSRPFVMMVIGVNGVGKTTTIGKIARKFLNSGQSVLLVAADTFRAAASSQLKIWGERNNVRVISEPEGADPSAVVFDGMAVAISQHYDVVLIDTAGRLHTKANLMEELKKIKRVIAKQMEGAPHEVLLVIDATTGQNGISQAILFNEAVEVSGIALTKLDGTAKGGIVVNIASELKLPIRFIGVGEQIDDLREFDAREFIDAIFGD